MNQPTIISAYANHSLLATLVMLLLGVVLDEAATVVASAAWPGSKSYALGNWGSVGSTTTSGDLEELPRIRKPYCTIVMPRPALEPFLAAWVVCRR